MPFFKVATFKATISEKKHKYDPRESSTRLSRYAKEMQAIQEQEHELEELKTLIAKRTCNLFYFITNYVTT